MRTPQVVIELIIGWNWKRSFGLRIAFSCKVGGIAPSGMIAAGQSFMAITKTGATVPGTK